MLSAFPLLAKEKAITGDKKYYYDESPPSLVSSNNFIKPKGLQAGGKVAITAPASPTSYSELRRSIRFFSDNDIKVEVGKTITERDTKYRYLSASDNERADEFMSYVQREDIDAIVCARGGYGVMRILDKIDYSIINKNPKIIIGFSDITALITPIFEKSGLVTFHGPVASSSFNTYSSESLKNNLFSSRKDILPEIQSDSAIVVNSGKSKGNLKGGNLKMLTSTLGTPYEVNLNNSILFLEDISEPSYKIDRMLNQLILSGKLDNVKGIAFGIFKGLNRRKPFYPTYSFTIREVIEELLSPLNIPILIGLPFGHTAQNSTLPIGVQAEINTNKKSITLLESPIK